MEEHLLASIGDGAVFCERGATVAVFIIGNVVLCRAVTAELGLALLLPGRLPRLPAIAASTIVLVIVVVSGGTYVCSNCTIDSPYP